MNHDAMGTSHDKTRLPRTRDADGRNQRSSKSGVSALAPMSYVADCISSLITHALPVLTFAATGDS